MALIFVFTSGLLVSESEDVAIERTSGTYADCKRFFELCAPEIDEKNFVSIEYFYSYVMAFLGDGSHYVVVKTKDIEVAKLESSKRWVKLKDASVLLKNALNFVFRDTSEKLEKYVNDDIYISPLHIRREQDDTSTYAGLIIYDPHTSTLCYMYKKFGAGIDN